MIGSRTTRGALLWVCAVLALALPASAQAAVLYDQTDNPAVPGRGSNVYAPPNADWTNQTADDFTVPAGQSWQVSQVDVLGVVDPGPNPISNVNLFLYANAGTLPGSELFRELGIGASGQPNYSVPVTGAPDLPPGTYWVSVQQTGAVLGSAQWYWTERTVQSGNPAAFRSPGGHAGAGCTSWVAGTTCISGGPPDQLFKLSGTAAPYPPPSPSNQFKLGALKRNRKKGTAKLTVTVPGPGTLALAGKGLVPQRPGRASAERRAGRTVAAAGPVKLLIEAKGKAKKKLKATGKVKVTAAITFTPTGGTPSSQKKKVVLKKL